MDVQAADGSIREPADSSIESLETDLPDTTCNPPVVPVVVITPFNGENEMSMQRHLCDYLRVKHIIENVVAIKSAPGSPITNNYTVDVCQTYSSDISAHAINKIANANVVIAILSEINVNVIYELGIRNLLRTETILLISRELASNRDDSLPVYLHDYAYNKYQAADPAIVAEFNKFQGELGWKTKELPQSLGELIDESDTKLTKILTNSLQEIQDRPGQWPSHMRELARDRHPNGFLSGWKTYFPTSVLRINWKSKTGDGGLTYDPNDIVGEPVVCDADYLFRQIFRITGIDFDSQNSPKVTFSYLMSNIERYVDKETYQAFLDNQAELRDEIILRDGDAVAKVPLRFYGPDDAVSRSQLHPIEHLRGKVFLPSLTAKTSVGETRYPHTTYLIITFVEDFWPYGHENNSWKSNNVAN